MRIAGFASWILVLTSLALTRPVFALEGGCGVVAVSGGENHSLALASDGSVWAWGVFRPTAPGSDVPVRLPEIGAAASVSAGRLHSLVAQRDGKVVAWGQGFFGQLGNGTRDDSNEPRQVQGLPHIVSLAAGSAFSLALASDGTVWSWGDNGAGELGIGTVSFASLVPVQVLGPNGGGFLHDVIAIAAGSGHSLALKSDGTVWAWGGNWWGQLGVPRISQSTTPTRVVGEGGSGFLGGIVAIAAGAGHSLALTSDGCIWAWGNGTAGQLGNGVYTPIAPTPVRVNGTNGADPFERATAIAAGSWQSLARRSDGTLWAWGANGDGQLGIGRTDFNAFDPQQVVGPSGVGWLEDVTTFGSTVHHTIAVTGGADTWAWGYAFLGQYGYGHLGNGTGGGSRVAVRALFPPGNDIISPVVTCPSAQSLPADIRCCATWNGSATAIDNCDPNPTVSSGQDMPMTFCTTGDHWLTYRAADAAGNTSTCTTTVAVADETPPTVDLSILGCLWPPNHEFVDAHLAVTASDNCTVGDLLTTSVSIASDEPPVASSNLDGGDQCPDAVVRGSSLFLRAERDDRGDGRVYHVVVRVADAAALSTTTAVETRVPHDRHPRGTGDGSGQDACRALDSASVYDPTTCDHPKHP